MTDDFAPDGQLAKAIPGFKPREPQRQMAVARCTQAIEKSQPLVVRSAEPVRAKPTLTWLLRCGRKRKSLSQTGSKAAAGSALCAAICRRSQRR
ncbi:hypothetical protein ACLB1E_20100 [Escherichia coli]